MRFSIERVSSILLVVGLGVGTLLPSGQAHHDPNLAYQGARSWIDAKGDCDAAALACTAAIAVALAGCITVTGTWDVYATGNVLNVFPVSARASVSGSVTSCNFWAASAVAAQVNWITGKMTATARAGNLDGCTLPDGNSYFCGWGNAATPIWRPPDDYCVLPPGGHQQCGPTGPSIGGSGYACVGAEAWVNLNGEGFKVGPFHTQGASSAYVFARSNDCNPVVDHHPSRTIPPPASVSALDPVWEQIEDLLQTNQGTDESPPMTSEGYTAVAWSGVDPDLQGQILAAHQDTLIQQVRSGLEDLEGRGTVNSGAESLFEDVTNEILAQANDALKDFDGVVFVAPDEAPSG